MRGRIRRASRSSSAPRAKCGASVAQRTMSAALMISSRFPNSSTVPEHLAANLGGARLRPVDDRDRGDAGLLQVQRGELPHLAGVEEHGLAAREIFEDFLRQLHGGGARADRRFADPGRRAHFPGRGKGMRDPAVQVAVQATLVLCQVSLRSERSLGVLGPDAPV